MLLEIAVLPDNLCCHLVSSMSELVRLVLSLIPIIQLPLELLSSRTV